MTLNHVHLGVRDLSGALEWLQRIWQVGPAFQNERLATLQFGAFILILDAVIIYALTVHGDEFGPRRARG